MSIITLTSDFGGNDPFFGIMKGVILTICPDARIEDITHDISPQNIWQANFIIQASYHYFPKGTIHVCVVDPGVGSERKPILIESKNYFFIGPDNGIFTGILEKEDITNAIELTEKKYWLPNVSQTFHGRDIFSPVAGHLAGGINSNAFGKKIKKEDLTSLPMKKPVKNKNGCKGVIQYIDHFGNLITNIPNEGTPDKITGKIMDINFNGLVSSFGDANNKGLTAIKGSSGYIELFIYKDNAKLRTGVKIGNDLEISFVVQ